MSIDIGRKMHNNTRKNPTSQDSPPAAGRVSDIYISASVRSLGEIFV